MCDKCGKECCKVVITKQGERGPQGPVGPPGRIGDTGAQGAPGVSLGDYFSATLDFSVTADSGYLQPTGAVVTVPSNGTYMVHALVQINPATPTVNLTLFVNGVATTDLGTPKLLSGLNDGEHKVIAMLLVDTFTAGQLITPMVESVGGNTTVNSVQVFLQKTA